MTSPRLPSSARPIAACFRQVRQRLADVRQRARELAPLRGFRNEVAARICTRLRRETRLQRQAMHQLLHALCDESLARQRARGEPARTPSGPSAHLPRKDTSPCTLH